MEFQDIITLSIEDFENPEFCRTFATHHKVEVYINPPVDEFDLPAMYGLSWQHGVLGDGPRAEFGENCGYYWAALFIFFWKYKKVSMMNIDKKLAPYMKAYINDHCKTN